MAENENSMKIVAVGDGEVGKTCMVFSYAKNEFPESYNVTVFENYAVNVSVDGLPYTVTIFDTAGQEEYNSLRSVIATCSKPHSATISHLRESHHEQNILKIFTALQDCMTEFQAENSNSLEKVEILTVSGQMHGVMLWNSEKIPDFHPDCGPFSHALSTKVSSLITWLDKRTDSDFLTSLPVPKLDNAGLPVDLLPLVVKSGEIAGNLIKSWFSIPKGTPVLAALGDFQAGIASHINPNTAVITIGTSAQICCMAGPDFKPPQSPDVCQPIQYFPFFDSEYMAVGASLNGGNVLGSFLEMIQSWLSSLGIEGLPEKQLWAKIESLLIKEVERLKSGQDAGNVMDIVPTIFPERHSPETFGSVHGISSGNFKQLGHVLYSLVRGIVENLNKIMPLDFLKQRGVKNILLMGEARKPWFRLAVERIYENSMFELIVSDMESNSAVGCAMIGCKSNKIWFLFSLAVYVIIWQGYGYGALRAP